MPMWAVMVAGLLMIASCVTPTQRKAAEREALQKEAVKEISRICALSEAEREAVFKRIKDESGLVLQCAKK